VRDSGRGLSQAQLALIFEPFNRLGLEHESIEGTGIGLTIVRDLVQRMGGRISVTSEPGQGSKFSVCWPLVAPPAAGAAAESAINAGHATSADDGAVARTAVAIDGAALKPLDLLYIEDNPVNVLLLQELLAQRPNVRMRSADDGSGGLNMALEHTPDVLLIDMQLPDFDGMEVLRRLKAMPTLTAVRLIALSANAMPDDVSNALASGFHDYWTKPIDMKKVLEKLDALSQS
jgi:CheY-like chemotaxis protein